MSAVGGSAHLWLAASDRRRGRTQAMEAWVLEKGFRQCIVHPLPHRKGKRDSAPCPQPSLALWPDPPFDMVTWKPKDKGEPGRSQGAQLQENLCWITAQETQLRKGHLPYPWLEGWPSLPTDAYRADCTYFYQPGDSCCPWSGQESNVQTSCTGKRPGLLLRLLSHGGQ